MPNLRTVEDALEEEANPAGPTVKTRPFYAIWRSRRMQKVLTYAATTVAVGLSISALLLYKDTVSDVIGGPDLVYTFDL